MLEYLPCNLRQKTTYYVIDDPSQQVYLVRFFNPRYHRRQLVAIGNKALALRAQRVVIPPTTLPIERVYILHASGLELSATGGVHGSGVWNLEKYFDREGSEKEYFPS